MMRWSDLPFKVMNLQSDRRDSASSVVLPHVCHYLQRMAIHDTEVCSDLTRRLKVSATIGG